MDKNSMVFRFDDFVVNAKSRIISRNGETISLTPRVFDTLLAFLDRPGETITKEELMTAVWAGSFVEESNLTQNVAVLRKALGDNGKNRRFIVTVSRRGYRFVHDVERGYLPSYGSAPSGVYASEKLLPRESSVRRGLTPGWAVLVLLALTAICAGVLVYVLLRS